MTSITVPSNASRQRTAESLLLRTITTSSNVDPTIKFMSSIKNKRRDVRRLNHRNDFSTATYSPYSKRTSSSTIKVDHFITFADEYNLTISKKSPHATKNTLTPPKTSRFLEKHTTVNYLDSTLKDIGSRDPKYHFPVVTNQSSTFNSSKASFPTKTRDRNPLGNRKLKANNSRKNTTNNQHVRGSKSHRVLSSTSSKYPSQTMTNPDISTLQWSSGNGNFSGNEQQVSFNTSSLDTFGSTAPNNGSAQILISNKRAHRPSARRLSGSEHIFRWKIKTRGPFSVSRLTPKISSETTPTKLISKDTQARNSKTPSPVNDSRIPSIVHDAYDTHRNGAKNTEFPRFSSKRASIGRSVAPPLGVEQFFSWKTKKRRPSSGSRFNRQNSTSITPYFSKENKGSSCTCAHPAHEIVTSPSVPHASSFSNKLQSAHQKNARPHSRTSMSPSNIGITRDRLNLPRIVQKSHPEIGAKNTIFSNTTENTSSLQIFSTKPQRRPLKPSFRAGQFFPWNFEKPSLQKARQNSTPRVDLHSTTSRVAGNSEKQVVTPFLGVEQLLSWKVKKYSSLTYPKLFPVSNLTSTVSPHQSIGASFPEWSVAFPSRGFSSMTNKKISRLDFQKNIFNINQRVSTNQPFISNTRYGENIFKELLKPLLFPTAPAKGHNHHQPEITSRIPYFGRSDSNLALTLNPMFVRKIDSLKAKVFSPSTIRFFDPPRVFVTRVSSIQPTAPPFASKSNFKSKIKSYFTLILNTTRGPLTTQFVPPQRNFSSQGSTKSAITQSIGFKDVISWMNKTHLLPNYNTSIESWWPDLKKEIESWRILQKVSPTQSTLRDGLTYEHIKNRNSIIGKTYTPISQAVNITKTPLPEYDIIKPTENLVERKRAETKNNAITVKLSTRKGTLWDDSIYEPSKDRKSTNDQYPTLITEAVNVTKPSPSEINVDKTTETPLQTKRAEPQNAPITKSLSRSFVKETSNKSTIIFDVVTTSVNRSVILPTRISTVESTNVPATELLTRGLWSERRQQSDSTSKIITSLSELGTTYITSASKERQAHFKSDPDPKFIVTDPPSRHTTLAIIEHGTTQAENRASEKLVADTPKPLPTNQYTIETSTETTLAKRKLLPLRGTTSVSKSLHVGTSSFQTTLNTANEGTDTAEAMPTIVSRPSVTTFKINENGIASPRIPPTIQISPEGTQTPSSFPRIPPTIQISPEGTQTPSSFNVMPKLEPGLKSATTIKLLDIGNTHLDVIAAEEANFHLKERPSTITTNPLLPKRITTSFGSRKLPVEVPTSPPQSFSDVEQDSGQTTTHTPIRELKFYPKQVISSTLLPTSYSVSKFKNIPQSTDELDVTSPTIIPSKGTGTIKSTKLPSIENLVEKPSTRSSLGGWKEPPGSTPKRTTSFPKNEATDFPASLDGKRVTLKPESDRTIIVTNLPLKDGTVTFLVSKKFHAEKPASVPADTPETTITDLFTKKSFTLTPLDERRNFPEGSRTSTSQTQHRSSTSFGMIMNRVSGSSDNVHILPTTIDSSRGRSVQQNMIRIIPSSISTATEISQEDISTPGSAGVERRLESVNDNFTHAYHPRIFEDSTDRGHTNFQRVDDTSMETTNAHFHKNTTTLSPDARKLPADIPSYLHTTFSDERLGFEPTIRKQFLNNKIVNHTSTTNGLLITYDFEEPTPGVTSQVMEKFHFTSSSTIKPQAHPKIIVTVQASDNSTKMHLGKESPTRSLSITPRLYPEHDSKSSVSPDVDKSTNVSPSGSNFDLKKYHYPETNQTSTPLNEATDFTQNSTISPNVDAFNNKFSQKTQAKTIFDDSTGRISEPTVKEEPDEAITSFEVPSTPTSRPHISFKNIQIFGSTELPATKESDEKSPRKPYLKEPKLLPQRDANNTVNLLEQESTHSTPLSETGQTFLKPRQPETSIIGTNPLPTYITAAFAERRKIETEKPAELPVATSMPPPLEYITFETPTRSPLLSHQFSPHGSSTSIAKTQNRKNITSTKISSQADGVTEDAALTLITSGSYSLTSSHFNKSKITPPSFSPNVDIFSEKSSTGNISHAERQFLPTRVSMTTTSLPKERITDSLTATTTGIEEFQQKEEPNVSRTVRPTGNESKSSVDSRGFSAALPSLAPTTFSKPVESLTQTTPSIFLQERLVHEEQKTSSALEPETTDSPRFTFSSLVARKITTPTPSVSSISMPPQNILVFATAKLPTIDSFGNHHNRSIQNEHNLPLDLTSSAAVNVPRLKPTITPTILPFSRIQGEGLLLQTSPTANNNFYAIHPAEVKTTFEPEEESTLIVTNLPLKHAAVASTKNRRVPFMQSPSLSTFMPQTPSTDTFDQKTPYQSYLESSGKPKFVPFTTSIQNTKRLPFNSHKSRAEDDFLPTIPANAHTNIQPEPKLSYNVTHPPTKYSFKIPIEGKTAPLENSSFLSSTREASATDILNQVTVQQGYLKPQAQLQFVPSIPYIPFAKTVSFTSRNTTVEGDFFPTTPAETQTNLNQEPRPRSIGTDPSLEYTTKMPVKSGKIPTNKHSFLPLHTRQSLLPDMFPQVTTLQSYFVPYAEPKFLTFTRPFINAERASLTSINTPIEDDFPPTITTETLTSISPEHRARRISTIPPFKETATKLAISKETLHRKSSSHLKYTHEISSTEKLDQETLQQDNFQPRAKSKKAGSIAPIQNAMRSSSISHETAGEDNLLPTFPAETDSNRHSEPESKEISTIFLPSYTVKMSVDQRKIQVMKSALLPSSTRKAFATNAFGQGTPEQRYFETGARPKFSEPIHTIDYTERAFFTRPNTPAENSILPIIPEEAQTYPDPQLKSRYIGTGPSLKYPTKTTVGNRNIPVMRHSSPPSYTRQASLTAIVSQDSTQQIPPLSSKTVSKKSFQRATTLSPFSEKALFSEQTANSSSWSHQSDDSKFRTTSPVTGEYQTIIPITSRPNMLQRNFSVIESADSQVTKRSEEQYPFRNSSVELKSNLQRISKNDDTFPEKEINSTMLQIVNESPSIADNNGKDVTRDERMEIKKVSLKEIGNRESRIRYESSSISFSNDSITIPTEMPTDDTYTDEPSFEFTEFLSSGLQSIGQAIISPLEALRRTIVSLLTREEGDPSDFLSTTSNPKEENTEVLSTFSLPSLKVENSISLPMHAPKSVKTTQLTTFPANSKDMTRIRTLRPLNQEEMQSFEQTYWRSFTNSHTQRLLSHFPLSTSISERRQSDFASRQPFVPNMSQRHHQTNKTWHKNTSFPKNTESTVRVTKGVTKEVFGTHFSFNGVSVSHYNSTPIPTSYSETIPPLTINPYYSKPIRSPLGRRTATKVQKKTNFGGLTPKSDHHRLLRSPVDQNSKIGDDTNVPDVIAKKLEHQNDDVQLLPLKGEDFPSDDLDHRYRLHIPVKPKAFSKFFPILHR
nr:PREDICTED: uncharacterized protein LOC109038892 [Bemisia tabaci]